MEKRRKLIFKKASKDKSLFSFFRSHTGMYLDTKLNFQEYLNKVLSKVNKTIGLLRKLQIFLPHQPFIRPHLDYKDIIYDQTYNDSLHQKVESI